MTLRRRRLLSALKENEIAPTVTCFPLMGVGNFISWQEGQDSQFDAPHSKSIFVPDNIINPHPRFAALTTNIRERRGKKVDIKVPLFKDENTPEFKSGLTEEEKEALLPPGIDLEENGQIYMDCMAFGMGMCCLVSFGVFFMPNLVMLILHIFPSQQVTFQAKDVNESRYMYDQLAVLAPIMLALTAATPIFKGRLSDIDARWTVISQSVDDRTDAEKGLLSEEEVNAVMDPRLAGGGIRR